MVFKKNLLQLVFAKHLSYGGDDFNFSSNCKNVLRPFLTYSAFFSFSSKCACSVLMISNPGSSFANSLHLILFFELNDFSSL